MLGMLGRRVFDHYKKKSYLETNI